jgi:4'-phosphopantetheinyl transferase
MTTDDVDVRTFDLTEPVDDSVLDAGERQRAERFRFERDRVRFRRRRAHLRHLLAGHAGGNPAELRFARNRFGKPSLLGSRIAFSASSSGDVAMIAVGSGALGIDVELVRPAAADEDVARRLFAREEAAAVLGGDSGDFFRCWTRKEAYVKAIGCGLSFPLHSFAVEVGDVAHPRLFRSDLRPVDLHECAITDLSDRKKEFAAALVVHKPPRHASIRSNQGPEGTRS